MAIKIIHCADLHFDSPFTGLDSPKKAEIRREELRQAFGRIVRLAADEKADALLICGDLFDGASVSAHTLRYIKEKFAEIPQIPVFICAGNHDPKTTGSYYKIFDWGDNVHIFSEQTEKIEFDGFDIYGASFKSMDEPESKLSGFKVENSEKINIMAMHADIGGSYNPITAQEIETSGLSYLALGHVHSYSGALAYGKTVAAYPGCPEGRGYDETGEKGVIKAIIDKNGTQLEFVPISKRIYHQVEVDVTGAANYEALCGRILMAMKGKAEDLYKIVLTGEAEFPVQPAIILENLQCFSAKIKDETHAHIDYDAMKDEYSLKGIFLKNILADKNDENAQLINQALGYGLAAISGEKVKLP